MTNLPAQLSTIVFDVGNTLHHLDHAFIAATISTAGHAADAHAVAVAEYDAKAAVDEQFRARAAGIDGARQVPYYQTILERLGVPEAMYADIVSVLRTENEQRSLWRVMHPSTPAVLAELRNRGFTLGVVSNADGRVAAALAAGGIADYFDAIIDSHLVGVEKPDPRIFELALTACAAQPADTLYVGDIYEIDVRGARRAGLSAVLIDPLGLYPEVDCIRIASLDRLLDLLPRTAARQS